MPYSKEQRKKYRLNFNWKKLEELEKEQNATDVLKVEQQDYTQSDPMKPYYQIYYEWLRSNGLKSTEETEEIYRKCYSIYNSKKTIFEEMINRGYRIGVLQNKIDESQTEINKIQAKVEKYKKLYKMTIKPTNYEKFHYTWNSIVDDKEPKKSQRIKKTEEFIVGYLLENDKLFNKIVVARKLMGKGI